MAKNSVSKVRSPKISVENWVFNEKYINSIDDFPDDTFGFVYLLSFSIDGVNYYYIGRKNLMSIRKIRLGKKEIDALKDKRSSKFKIVKKESDWKSYTGSSKKLNALLNEDKDVLKSLKRVIIKLCKNELELKWSEVKEIICSGAMESEYFLNDNVRINQIGKINIKIK